MKARLAAVLLAERVKRGGGDARRFPQPEMARLLDYSLRQYQRLEDPDDPSLPGWGDLERLMGALGLDPAAIFAEEPGQTPSPELPVTADELAGLRQDVAEVKEGLERVERLLRKAESQADEA